MTIFSIEASVYIPHLNLAYQLMILLLYHTSLSSSGWLRKSYVKSSGDGEG